LLGVLSVLTLGLPAGGSAQQAATGSVTGLVSAEGSLAPIAAAQVHIAELQIGVLTQANGRFLLLNVPVGTHTVRVERLGYRVATQQVTVTAGQPTQLNVTLGEDVLALDELVVTGTAGQARRREVGNTVSQIRAGEIEEPVTNMSSMLQGRLPGVVVREGSGSSGSAPDIRLRGNVSVTMSNNPLIYIDGVRAKSDYYGWNGGDVMSPLNDLNPSDIERIEVVKGPAATTLYGTEAAAGVIQIFTKSGGSQTTAPLWTAEVKQGFAYYRPFGPDTRGFGASGYVGPGFEAGDVQSWTPQGARFMYLDPVLRRGLRQGYNISVRGGSPDRLGYFVSSGYDDNQSALLNDWEKQLTLRGNLQFRPWDDLLIQFNNSFTNTKLRQVYQGNSGSGIVMTAYRGDDSYIGDRSPETLIDLTTQRNLTNVDRFVSGLTFNYTPFTSFTNRLTLGHDYSERSGDRIFDYCWRCKYGRPNDFGSVNRNVNQNRIWSFDYVGTLNFTIPGVSGLTSSFSYGVQGVQNERERVSVTGSDLPGPGEYTVNAGARVTGASQDKIKEITGGFFVQDMLSLSDRYFLTLGLRVDGNSAFGSGFGLQPYPKASLSYIISDESFWPESLGTMKLRGAYGWAGRAPGSFDAVRTWTAGGWGTTEAAFNPSNLGNPDLGPERSREIEVGFDASFLNDRVSLEATYFDQLTTDALFNVRQPASTGGWASQRENIGKLKNMGWEMALNATLIQTRSFRWDLGTNVSMNDSEVLSLGGQPAFSSGGAWIDEGLQVGVRRGDRIMNWYEQADPVIERNAIYGPGWPTETVHLSTSFTLPGQIVISGRGEYNGNFWITNGAESLALQRSIPVPKCFNAYQLAAANQRDRLLAWERAHCFGMASGSLNTVPGDYMELRDITANVPLSSLLPSLTGVARSMDLTISGRNLWYRKDKKLVSGHPEMTVRESSSGTSVDLAPGTGEQMPIQSFFTVALRVTF
jgi:TonB-linked SusC/RagA family outer membrane protein